jgi:hypothetical protein
MFREKYVFQRDRIKFAQDYIETKDALHEATSALRESPEDCASLR